MRVLVVALVSLALAGFMLGCGSPGGASWLASLTCRAAAVWLEQAVGACGC